MFCYFIRTCSFILFSVTADPLLLEMQVEQLELRLRRVEEAQTVLLARLEQYESREARGEHQETYNHQCTPWSLDYEPLTDTTEFYSTGQPCSLLSQSTHCASTPGQQPWGQLSQVYSPGQQSWSQTCTLICTPGEQSRSLLTQSSYQTSAKNGQLSTMPSAEIDKALLPSIESAHHHLCVPSKATNYIGCQAT